MKLIRLMALMLAIPAFAQTQYLTIFSPPAVMTGTGQTSSVVQLGTSWTSGNITVVGSSLTTATLAVQGSSDGGVTYTALPIYSVASPGTSATTVTVTANSVYQLNLAGLTHIRYVTSGTFTATNITITLTASPNGMVARSGSGGSGITQLTGDVAAGPGSGSQAATLATVNSSPGTCGDGTHVCQVTVNGKGLTTAQTAVAITAAQTWPAAPGIPVCSGTPCTAWGTSLTAPSGTIVGTTDTQTLTNKTVDTATPAEVGYLSGVTSAIQTQLNTKTQTIASGTSALGTSAISSGACATVVTTSATGTATTDVPMWGFNADPTSTTGYSASSSGMLTIIAYPTTDNVNFRVCNNTASSITPGAITLNWRVVR